MALRFLPLAAARGADSTFMRDKRIAHDGRGRHYAPPHVSSRCKAHKHSECIMRNCTCPCGHPVSWGSR